jgi:class 3 adenylate cyclase/CheY-like chemotaxis protein
MRSTGSGATIRLLVVDDEPDVQALFELRFRREIQQGVFDLRFASNGTEAIDVVSRDPRIEVVVTDLNMPGMSGLELLTRLDQLDLPLKTIVLTAYGDMANIRTAMMRGAFDFQVKPLDIDDLRATIRKASTIVRELRAGEEARHRARVLEERNEYLTEVFGKYVSDEVVRQLLSSPDGVNLGGETRHLTLMLADIRGFSRLSNRLPPERVVQVLNSYLEVAAERILARGGTINEILGDGLLVFFGAPIADDAAAEHAVAAALELQLAMAQLNERHRAVGLPELAIGIAIHTGEAVVGTIGSPQRLKYTAVGPNVNVVGRIESYARGGQILVSDSTHELVQDLVSVAGRFCIKAKGEERGDLLLHVVRGLGGHYRLELPQSNEPMHAVSSNVPACIARVVDDRIGEDVACELVAVGRESARVRTTLMLAPLDDVVLRVKAVDLYGRVSECEVTDDGACVFTLVYNAVADTLDHVLDDQPPPISRSGRHSEDRIRRTRPARADR